MTTTESVESATATAAYVSAAEYADATEHAYDECDCSECLVRHNPATADPVVYAAWRDKVPQCSLWRAWHDADAARDAARDAWLAAVIDSEEEVEWALGGESWQQADGARWTGFACEAKENLEEESRIGWDDVTETMWVHNYACFVDPVTDESIDGWRINVIVEISPDAPACDDCEHDWCSPISVVGGIAENPGVWGHGGGVIIREVCAHCGVYRVTDTWAQDRSTGEQGLRSVEYEPADEDSLAWVSA